MMTLYEGVIMTLYEGLKCVWGGGGGGGGGGGE